MLHFISRFQITLSNIRRQYNNSPLNLVVLHGLMGSKKNFNTVTQYPEITTHLNSVSLLDLRNHGESPHTQQMSLQDMANDLYEYIQQEENVVLLGHSLGGRVIFQYLASHHYEAIENVKGVIIADILPTAVQSTFILEMLQKLVKIDLTYISYNQLFEQLIRISQSKPIAQLLMTNLQCTQLPTPKREIPTQFSWRIGINSILQNFHTNIQTDLQAHWRGPHCVICGDKSQYVNKNTINSMKQIFPDFIEAHWIQNCGHWVHSEQPKQFAKIVSQFIQTLK